MTIVDKRWGKAFFFFFFYISTNAKTHAFNTILNVVIYRCYLLYVQSSPKHLAPLDNIFRNGSARSSLENLLLLKQSSILPISSKSRRRLERISRSSSRSSRGTRAGSEESNSCSSSSQEEDETVPQDTHKIHMGLDKSLNLDFRTLSVQ